MCLRTRDSWFDEVEQWRGEDEQADGPGSERRAETIALKQGLHDQGKDNASEPGPGPHDAVC